MQQWDCASKLDQNEEFVIHKVAADEATDGSSVAKEQQSVDSGNESKDYGSTGNKSKDHEGSNATNDEPSRATNDDESNGTEIVYITWEKHPDICWAFPPKMKNNLHLRIRKCGDQPDKFIIPKNGVGIIRPREYPDYCLDAIKGGSAIMYYKCNEANSKSNLQWVLPKSLSGAVKPLHSPNKCVDVPDGKTADDTYLQQWGCSSSMENHEAFILHKAGEKNCGNDGRTLGRLQVGMFSTFFLLSWHLFAERG
jgi:hypothetical protein